MWVRDQCYETIISKTVIDDQIIRMGSDVQFDFEAWSESVGDCGPFVYTTTLANNDPMPYFLSLNNTSFKIDHELLLERGIY